MVYYTPDIPFCLLSLNTRKPTNHHISAIFKVNNGYNQELSLRKSPMIETCERSELKYLINKMDHLILDKKLKTILSCDPHADSTGYVVKSVYFDDFSDTAWLDNLVGAGDREKFRIRYYNNDTSFINLEKKIKKLSKGTKLISRLTQDEAQGLIEGRFEVIKTSQDPLLKEFYLKAKQRGLRAKVIVAYQRMPYLYNAGNVRITLDSQIRNSLDVRRFFDPDLSLVPQLSQQCLLEVKFDRYLPEVVRHLIQVPNTIQTAHSKYSLSRLFNT